MDFPIVTTKMGGKVFDLTLASDRKEYFEVKAGPEIKKLRDYLQKNTFIVYLLGKKGSGKGTYAKMLKEIIGGDAIEHISVGDMVRSFDNVLKDPIKKQELIDFLDKKYRGPVAVSQIIEAMEGRSTKVLLPSELILALTEREITRLGKKAIFIDGFPRDVDQVSYSLFFKHLIDYRQDPDIFVLIDVPLTVIDERIKQRVVCPVCNASRSLKFLPTKHVKYDQEKNSFYLLCDNTGCTSGQDGEPARLVTKEGDQAGIEPIRSRLEKDGKLMEQIKNMHGLSRVYLRNSVPVDKAQGSCDDYEITPEYDYEFNAVLKNVVTVKKPWEFLDDQGRLSNSLMPPPVLVALIKGLVEQLGLS